MPQMVTLSTRTIASVGSLTAGSGTSSQADCPGPWKTKPFMAFLTFTSVVRLRPDDTAARPSGAGYALRVQLVPRRWVPHGPVGPGARPRGALPTAVMVGARTPPDREQGTERPFRTSAGRVCLVV
ncbi:hypothetical protein GCM10010121_016400 [Streptomyces brasiliensis]|uniref:Uncharacterized protein n=1 Tax=Streptomyces brasiliensis TaxID=1954 RepID=A0A917NK40_9ACTN|nr:hypothetical protein GCM10010121_016400 [Streptomyces brasiliensis]